MPTWLASFHNHEQDENHFCFRACDFFCMTPKTYMCHKMPGNSHKSSNAKTIVRSLCARFPRNFIEDLTTSTLLFFPDPLSLEQRIVCRSRSFQCDANARLTSFHGLRPSVLVSRSIFLFGLFLALPFGGG